MEVTREQLEHYRPLNLNLTLANGEEDIIKVTDIVYSGLKLLLVLFKLYLAHWTPREMCYKFIVISRINSILWMEFSLN